MSSSSTNVKFAPSAKFDHMTDYINISVNFVWVWDRVILPIPHTFRWKLKVKLNKIALSILSSESPSPSQKSSQVQRKSQKESRTWTLLTLWSSPPPYNLMHSPYNLMHHLITSCTTHHKLFIYAKISLFEQHAVQKVENIIEWRASSQIPDVRSSIKSQIKSRRIFAWLSRLQSSYPCLLFDNDNQ